MHWRSGAATTPAQRERSLAESSASKQIIDTVTLPLQELSEPALIPFRLQLAT